MAGNVNVLQLSTDPCESSANAACIGESAAHACVSCLAFSLHVLQSATRARRPRGATEERAMSVFVVCPHSLIFTRHYFLLRTRRYTYRTPPAAYRCKLVYSPYERSSRLPTRPKCPAASAAVLVSPRSLYPFSIIN